MRSFKYNFNQWNGTKKAIKTEEWTKHSYRNIYEDEIPKAELDKHLESLETWANYAHHNKKLYELTVLDEFDQPYAALGFNECCTLEFLDEYNRIYMRYCFEELKPGWLFLDQMCYWEYEKNEPGPNYENYQCETMYIFTPDGGLTVYKEYKEGGEWFKSEQSAAHPINVENNWEPYPEVGKYDSLVRMERWEEGDFLKGINIKDGK